MHIQEKNERWLNFFTPGVITVAGILLSALAVIPILLIDSFVPIFGEDSIIANISVGFLTQILGTILVFFLLIPLAKVKEAEYQGVSGSRILQTGLIFCLSFVIFWFSNLIFAIVYSVLNLVPETGYESILLIVDHLANPFNIGLLLGMVSIGAPVFEEYVYRRTLIPLLEDRGMAPFAAVIASSLVFALSHVPNDLINANMPNTVQHFWGVFIIGLTCGIVYILTRNVLYPMIIHGLYNGLSFGGYLVTLMEDITASVVLGLLVLVILVVGLGGGVYAVLKYRKDPETHWVHIIKEKSPHNIVPGLIGFVVIFVALITILVLVPLSMWALSGNVLLTAITEIGVEVVLFVVLVWFATKAEYVDKTEDVALSQSKVTA